MGTEASGGWRATRQATTDDRTETAINGRDTAEKGRCSRGDFCSEREDASDEQLELPSEKGGEQRYEQRNGADDCSGAGVGR